MYQAVEITGCFLRAVFVLAGQILRETGLKVPKFRRILSTAVNFSQGFTLIKFKSTLKHTQVFFKSEFKNYFLMKSLKPF